MLCLCSQPTGRHYGHPYQLGLQPGQNLLPLPAQVFLPPPGYPGCGPQCVPWLQFQVGVSLGPGSLVWGWGRRWLDHSPVGASLPIKDQHLLNPPRAGGKAMCQGCVQADLCTCGILALESLLCPFLLSEIMLRQFAAQPREAGCLSSLGPASPRTSAY